MAKVKKIDSPILALGIGGTGFDMLMRIKSEFNSRFEGEVYPDGSFSKQPPRTEYCEIDTDSSVEHASQYGMMLESGEFTDISGNFTAVRAALINKPYVKEWLDANLAAADINANGAGCYRQVSRLFLFNKYHKIYADLKGKLAALAKVTPAMAAKSKRISVKIMAGISGGTGSGTLLDVAYILRDIAAKNNYDVEIEAYLMMPDVTIDHAAGSDPNKKKLYSINSYAFLKELDYWMDAERTGITLNQQYTDTEKVIWQNAPLDYVYLLCSQNDSGAAIIDSYHHNIDCVAEYLVHNYESSDASGNEIFDTQFGKNGNGATLGNAAATQDNSFAFQSSRSNQTAIVNMMNQPYPVAMRYQSLGAFSNAGEDRVMIVKEWSLIYEETISRIDGHPVQMTGQAPVDFERDLLSLHQIVMNTHAASVRQNFNRRRPIPQLLDSDDARSLRDSDASAAPHGTRYIHYTAMLDQTVGDEELSIGKDLWEAFSAAGHQIGEDIERGPAYLRDLLLEGQNSFGVKLNNYIETITGLLSITGTNMDSNVLHAKNAFEAFKHRGLIEKVFNGKSKYDEYIAMVSNMYANAQNHAYYAALLPALKGFRKKVAEFSALLDSLVTAIKKQYNAYKEELQKLQAQNFSALFNTAAMQDDLVTAFANQERRDSFVREIYKTALRVTEICMTTAIADKDRPAMINEAIDQLRESEFISIGGTSLKQKIMAYEKLTTPEALTDYVTNTLCGKLMNGSQVMFYASPATQGLPDAIAAQVSLISLPANASEIEDGIKEFCKNHNLTVIIKHTQTNDRIFWVRDKTGMPLYFYGYLDTLRDTYNQSRGVHRAYHLYMNDNVNAMNALGRKDEMRQNWANVIPDPTIVRQAKETGAAAATLNKSLGSGLLRIDMTWPNNGAVPEATCFKRIFRDVDGVTISPTTIQHRLAAVEHPTDTQAALKLQPTTANESAIQKALENMKAYKAALLQIFDDRIETPFTFNHLGDAVHAWADVLNLSTYLIPLSASMAPDVEQKCKNAWEICYGRAIREVLSRRPDLLSELNIHQACIAIANEFIAKADDEIAAIDKLLGSVEHVDTDALLKDCATVARLLMYGLIDVKRVKVSTTVISGPNSVLFAKDTEYPQVELMFPGFEDYPTLLQFAAWFSTVGKHEMGAMTLTLDKEAQMREKVSDKDDSDDETDAILDVAKIWKAKLEEMRSDLMNSFAGHDIDKETYEKCEDMVDKISKEFSLFIKTWK